MEQQLPASLGEGQIAEFVEDDKVEAGEIVRHASVASGSAFRLELIDEIDAGEEALAGSRSDAASRDGDNQMGLAGTGRLHHGNCSKADDGALQFVEARAQGARWRENPTRPELLLQPEDVASVIVNALCLPRTAEVTDISIRPMIKS